MSPPCNSLPKRTMGLKLVCCPANSTSSSTNGTARRMLNGHPTMEATAKQVVALIERRRSAPTGSIAKPAPSMAKCMEKLDGRKAWEERKCQLSSAERAARRTEYSLVAELYMPALPKRKKSVYLPILGLMFSAMLR